jgi:hypothetical protein
LAIELAAQGSVAAVAEDGDSASVAAPPAAMAASAAHSPRRTPAIVEMVDEDIQGSSGSLTTNRTAASLRPG